jgi:phosphoribosylanthranilate isomerase
MYVKICGVTRLEDAEACARAGADAVGLNLVPASPRCLERRAARRLADALRGRLEVIAVTADLDEAALRALWHDLGCDRLQLHGHESPALVEALAPMAFKAVRIGDDGDVTLATAFGGAPLLVDARHGAMLGGTGRRVDVTLVEPLARQRQVLLAGGLTADNVTEAIAAVRPWGVDTASGVEAAPGIKDASRIAAFVAAARSAPPA